MPPLSIVVVGARLTGDLMIWDQLARALANRPPSAMLLLHGVGETAARLLEGDGLSADMAGRDEPTDRAIVTAMRQENRRAVQQLTDGGVPAVSFLGTDRGILGPEAVRADLLRGTASMGAVPVLGAVSGREGALTLPRLDEVCEAIARADSGHISVLWLSNRAVSGKISPSDAAAFSGEISLPKASNLPNLSVRVSGVSDVVSTDPGRTALVDWDLA